MCCRSFPQKDDLPQNAFRGNCRINIVKVTGYTSSQESSHVSSGASSMPTSYFWSSFRRSSMYRFRISVELETEVQLCSLKYSFVRTVFHGHFLVHISRSFQQRPKLTDKRKFLLWGSYLMNSIFFCIVLILTGLTALVVGGRIPHDTLKVIKDVPSTQTSQKRTAFQIPDFIFLSMKTSEGTSSGNTENSGNTNEKLPTTIVILTVLIGILTLVLFIQVCWLLLLMIGNYLEKGRGGAVKLQSFPSDDGLPVFSGSQWSASLPSRQWQVIRLNL